MKKIILTGCAFLLLAGGTTLIWAEDPLRSEVEKALDQYEGHSPAMGGPVLAQISIPNNGDVAPAMDVTSGLSEAVANEEKASAIAPDSTENINAVESVLEPSGNFLAPDLTLEPEATPDPVLNSVSQPAANETVTPLTQSEEDRVLSENIIDVLELKNIDIVDVLKLLSEKSKLNIIAGNDVQGRITIYLKNVKLKDALRIILDSNNLAYQVENGIIRVMSSKEYEVRYGHVFGGKIQTRIVPLKFARVEDVIPIFEQMKSQLGKIIADPKSNTLVLIDSPDQLKNMSTLLETIDIPVEVKVFELSYSKAKETSDKITEMLTPKIGQIRFDERSNKVIVRDTPQKVEEISRMIGAFDGQQKQVLIEAKIIQVVLSDDFKYGINWRALVEDYHNLELINKFDILGANDKKGQLSIGTIDSGDYGVVLQALETVGNTNILSSPSVTALNNQEARILIGSTEPYVTTTTTTPSSGPATTAESVNFIDVGVKLYVTPVIHQDNFITMKIKPEVSSVTRSLTTGNNNTIPIVETSEVETTVMVKDGITIVIGGLIKDEKIATDNKVPFLGDIPILGHAFRNRDDFKRKTEIIIFLTPKIISGDVAHKPATDSSLSSVSEPF